MKTLYLCESRGFMKNVIVSCPTWVGDLVMATPTLRALRATFPAAYVAYLCSSYSAGILENAPWCNEIILRNERSGARRFGELLRTARVLRERHFDTGILLTNSFSSACTFYLGKVERRIGYDRDFRSFLLTDNLKPLKDGEGFVPVPVIEYYLKIAEYLGCDASNKKMELSINESSIQKAEEIFAKHGVDTARKVVALNPGAAYGPAKCWPAEYYAEIGQWLSEEMNAEVLVLGAPSERRTAEKVASSMRQPPKRIFSENTNLKVLKALIRKLDLLITNDTGTRHIACAFGIPVITIFGSSDPRWTATGFDGEIALSINVECGPCMRRQCPTEHKCMIDLKPQVVKEAVKKQFAQSRQQ